MDPALALALVGAVRIAGALPVLRWRLAGALVAMAVDLSDLFLLGLIYPNGWPATLDYQAFDKWADQAYLATFLAAALRGFPRLPAVVAVVAYAWRMVGFVGFELGAVPREGLLVFPNLLEFWFLAVSVQLRWRPGFRWTWGRVVLVGAPVLAAKELQEWALHAARLFDTFTFFDALRWLWGWVAGRP
jgi:hypothetical protein